MVGITYVYIDTIWVFYGYADFFFFFFFQKPIFTAELHV